MRSVPSGPQAAFLLLALGVALGCGPDGAPAPSRAAASVRAASSGRLLATQRVDTGPPDGFAAVVAGIRPRGYGQGTYTRVAPAVGRIEYFVSTAGSDGNPGTSSAPFRTIARAAQVAQAGDVVTIGSGTYQGSVLVKYAGTAQKPIVFQAASRGGVVLTGGVHHFVPTEWTGGAMQSGATHVTVRGLIFRDYAPTTSPDGTDPSAQVRAAVGAIRGWRIEDCLFDHAGYSGLDIRGDSVEVVRSTFQYHHTLALAAVGASATSQLRGVEVRDVVLRGNNTRTDPLSGTVATKVVKFWRTRDAVIDNVESYANNGSGWWFDTDNANFTIRNSYLHDNRTASGRGIFLEADLAPGLIENNVLANNPETGLTIRDSRGVTVRHNLFMNNKRSILLVAQQDFSTHPLKDIRIDGNSFREWASASAIHTGGSNMPGAPGTLNIVADSSTYDPGTSTELSYWKNTGFLRSITELRNKIGWEKAGKIGTVSSPM